MFLNVCFFFYFSVKLNLLGAISIVCDSFIWPLSSARFKSPRITKGKRIHHLKTMNVYIKCHGKPSQAKSYVCPWQRKKSKSEQRKRPNFTNLRAFLWLVMQIVWLLIISIHTCTQWFCFETICQRTSCGIIIIKSHSRICFTWLGFLWFVSVSGIKFLVVLLLNNPTAVSLLGLWLIGCLIMILQTKWSGISVISLVYVD